LGLDTAEADENAAKPRPAWEQQDPAADEGGDKGGVLVLQHILQAGRAGRHPRDEPPGLPGKTQDEDECEERAGIERENRVPGGEPAESRGKQQVIGRVAPEVIGKLAVEPGQKSMIGERGEQHGGMAVQGQKSAGPEIQPIAQCLAGMPAKLAPDDGCGLEARRDDAENRQEDESRAGRNLTF
jgi:hypothetical protein